MLAWSAWRSAVANFGPRVASVPDLGLCVVLPVTPRNSSGPRYKIGFRSSQKKTTRKRNTKKLAFDYFAELDSTLVSSNKGNFVGDGGFPKRTGLLCFTICPSLAALFSQS